VLNAGCQWTTSRCKRRNPRQYPYR